MTARPRATAMSASACRGVLHVLLAACGNPAATGTKAASHAGDCFALLDEPPAVDCAVREPIAAAVLEHRRAAAECLADVNRAAQERARRSFLAREGLTLAALPTITHGGNGDSGEPPYPRDRLVWLRRVGAWCGELSLLESFVARDAAGQLVRVDMTAEVARSVEVHACGCTGCGPDPGPPPSEAAVLPPSERITRTLTLTWPIQLLETIAPPCA